MQGDQPGWLAGRPAGWLQQASSKCDAPEARAGSRALRHMRRALTPTPCSACPQERAPLQQRDLPGFLAGQVVPGMEDPDRGQFLAETQALMTQGHKVRAVRTRCFLPWDGVPHFPCTLCPTRCPRVPSLGAAAGRPLLATRLSAPACGCATRA